MFSLSPSELLTIGIVALIVFGPRRLPELARRAGRLASYLRSAAEEIRGEVEGDLKDVTKPFREASSDLAAAGKALRETADGELKWVEQAVEQTRAAITPNAGVEGVTGSAAAPGTATEPKDAEQPKDAAQPGAVAEKETTPEPDPQ